MSNANAARKAKCTRTWRYFISAGLPFMLTVCGSAQATPSAETWNLANGLRIVLLPIPGSSNVSIFTYLPMGLASDSANKSQWSHLIEHMVIRSTHPAMSREANAETLADHMRLDFYGARENWREGLAHHRAWLQDVKFNQETLEREKPQILRECDSTERSLATHKFAMAAWNQAVRHGATRVAIRGDIEKAELTAVQAYGDLRLAMIPKAVVCIVGGVSGEEARAATSETLGGLVAKGEMPQQPPIMPQNREVTWDLSTRHLIIAWPIPDVTHKDYAALYATAALLQMRLFNNPAMKGCGDILVNTEIATPDAGYFYINAPLAPDAAFDDVLSAIASHLSQFQEKSVLADIINGGQQLAYQLNHIPNLSMLQELAGHDTPREMVEANVGLQWGMQEFRLGPHRGTLVQNLSALTRDDVRAALTRYLAPEKRSVVTIRPE